MTVKKLKKHKYASLLEPMQRELVGVARWAAATGARIVIGPPPNRDDGGPRRLR